MYNNSGGQSGPSRGIRLSFLSPSDQSKFEQLFASSAIPYGGNKLPANVVSELLRRSKLDNNSLAAIWDLSSIANAPFLTFPEFAVAMFLTSKKIMGQNLPSSLPSNVREETEIAMATIASTDPQQSQTLVNTNIAPPPQQQQQYQLPMMTGMVPQMTGMPPQMTGMLPQMTGMPPQMTGMTPQVPMMTGMPMNNQLRPTPPPVPQLPMQTGYMQQPMQTGFQPSKPRLQNLDFAKKMMPNQNGVTNLLNPSLGTSEANKISWKISPEDKQRYREIFHAWEGSGSGFMSGDTAKDVFTQSQLSPSDLMKIWTLADKENKGSLDEDEFAIGMHLIYRKLNGFEIPTSLPAELIPPSSVLKKFVLGRRPPPSIPSFGSPNQPVQQPESESDDDDYVSSSRRKGQPQRSYSSRSYEEDEANVLILEDLRRQIQETKRTLDRMPKPSAKSYYNSTKYSLEELKEKIRRAHEDISNSLRTNPAHKQYLDNVETLSGLLETQKSLQDEIQYLCNRDIPVLARQLRGSAAELRDAKVRYSRKADTTQDFMAYIQPTGPGGSITESDRVRAKAKAMMAARKAGQSGSTSDAAYVLRRAEEEKEEADKKADVVERDMERSRTALLDMRADLRFLEEMEANRDLEDKKRFENGQDLSYELRRFIEQLDTRASETPSYASRQIDNSSPLTSSYKSPTVSSPTVNSPKPKLASARPRTAEEIKKEAERRVQERLAAIQAKRNPNKTITPTTPTISKPNEAEEAAQIDAERHAQEMLRNTVNQREELDRQKREAELERLRDNERLQRQREEEAEKARKQKEEDDKRREEEDKRREEEEERQFEERRKQILAKEEADRKARFEAIQREEEAEEAKKAQALDQKPEQAPSVNETTISSNNPFAKIQQNTTTTTTTTTIPSSSQAEKPNEPSNKRISYNPFAAFSAFSATKGAAKDDSDSDDDGWDVGHDSDDDIPAAGSAKNLAGMLFSAMSQRSSTESSPKPNQVDSTPPPSTNSQVPPPPPPPAPVAPVAPPPPAAVNNAFAPPPAAAGGDMRSALLGQIQAGTRLKKTETKDRSAASVSGRVIEGNNKTSTPVVPVAAPTEIAAPVPIAQPFASGNFVAELQARSNETPNTVALETTHDESLPEYEYVALWDYTGSGADDLSFAQDDVILVRDNNDAEDWWFGRSEKSQQTGYFPRNYVQLKPEAIAELDIKAKVLYDFQGPAGQGCLDCQMGDTIIILIKESDDWWKAKSEDGTREGLIPASYVEEL